MTILHTVQGSRVLVAIAGDLDLTTASALRQTLDQLIDQHPSRDLALDLSEVGFIDSSGLGVLLGRYRRLAPRGRALTLLGVRPTVRSVLAVAGVTQLMPVLESGERMRDVRS